jgi:predicted HicB family RNase H-like nuclease
MRRKKAKMGRPPKKASDKLSEIVTLRMNPADHKQLMKDALESGLSVSAYLQECWQKVRKPKGQG